MFNSVLTKPKAKFLYASRNDIIYSVIRKIIVTVGLLVLLILNACNTIKGTATGAGRDAKAIWHYGTCAWDWDKDCQKK